MTKIPTAIDAVRYRTAVIQRRERPRLTLGILAQPTEPWTESATWSVAGQRGCCLDGFYLSFRNAVGHLLGPSHLAAEFGSTSDAVTAVIQHLGAPETYATPERMAPKGNDHRSEDVLDVLWDFGIDAARLAPAPWTTRAFPEAQLIACELGRAYSSPGFLRIAVEQQERQGDVPFSPDDWANLMLGRDRRKAFSLDLGVATTPATIRNQEREHER